MKSSVSMVGYGQDCKKASLFLYYLFTKGKYRILYTGMAGKERDDKLYCEDSETVNDVRQPYEITVGLRELKHNFRKGGYGGGHQIVNWCNQMRKIPLHRRGQTTSKPD